ncbi:hypothetical protein COU36_03200 [Candidatus Micrarchaeota archaeon CG10_big_fil_rev_8_21_14_0_10_59_7]|nr:MAG: hypothetical protein COU36_03200 [Candidatus Micrarchaeota archaeon CG10_big_fil_rev_8_21_14_0_10_59_7]
MSCYTDVPLNPAFVTFMQSKGISSTFCVVRNGNEEGNYVISAEIPDWSDKASNTSFLRAGEMLKIELPLTFKDKFFSNREFQNIQIQYFVEKDGKTIYSATQKGNVTSATQLIFGMQTENDAIFAPFLAAMWVTPNDPCIERVISAAKELMPGRAFADYQGYAGKSDEEKTYMTMQQAKAVYDTLQGHGMSYVNSVTTFGDPTKFSQNVRLPYESLETKNANCIDGAVLYAAVFEKIGLEPIIIIIPGHAFVAVRNDRNASSVTFIETTATGTKSFEEAALAAEETYNRQMEGMNAGDNQSMVVPIDVAAARSLGVAPFPITNAECDVNITTTAAPQNPYYPTIPVTPQITCMDGTPNFQCSKTQQPLACIGGILIPDCFDCGCPSGYACYYDANCYAAQ